MAEQVTGTIGQEEVFLNNAASEATLRLILEGIKGGNKDAAAAIDKMASKAGLDSAAIEAANTSVRTSTDRFKTLNSSVDALTPTFNQLNQAAQHLTSGVGKASVLLEMGFSKLSGTVALFGAGLLSVVKFQEHTLESYRKLSQSGINFSGSLTDLRMAAANSYMSLDNFSKLMTDNKQELLNLGGTVNGGAVAFSKFSHSVMSSELGDHFLALGYSADEANQAMLTYLGAAGASNKEDLASNKALREGAAAYLEELDRLAELTGKSRQEQQETMKKLQTDADVQLTAARMPQEERIRFMNDVKYMTDQYGDAGKEIALANAQHRAVRTKEAMMLTSLAPGFEAAHKSMASAKVGSEEYKRAQHEMSLATQRGMNQFDTATLGYVKGIDQAKLATAKDQIAGRTSMEAWDAAEKKVAEEKAARNASEAATAAETEKSLKELGTSILAAVMPIVRDLMPVINGLVKGIASLIEVVFNHKVVLAGLVAMLIAYKSAQMAALGVEKLKQIKENGLADTLKKTFLGSGVLGSKTNPMYVIIVSSAKGLAENLEHGGSGKNEPGHANGGKGKGGIKGGIKNALKGGAAGLVGGLALGVAGDYAKEHGHAKTGAGLDVAGDALSGASTGAMLGSLAGPLGTAIGGALGGVIGGGISLYNNWDTLSGKQKPSEKNKEDQEEPPKMAEGGIVNKETSLIAGESGPEAIIPLSKLGQMLTTQNEVTRSTIETVNARSKDSISKESMMLASLAPEMESAYKNMASTKINSESKTSGLSNFGNLENLFNLNFSKLVKPLENLKEPQSLRTGIPILDGASSMLKNLNNPNDSMLDDLSDQITNSFKEVMNLAHPTEEKTVVQLELLNKTMQDLVKYVRDTADNTNLTHKATKSLGSLW